jgi:hypothetical protein
LKINSARNQTFRKDITLTVISVKDDVSFLRRQPTFRDLSTVDISTFELHHHLEELQIVDDDKDYDSDEKEGSESSENVSENDYDRSDGESCGFESDGISMKEKENENEEDSVVITTPPRGEFHSGISFSLI